MNNIIIDKKFLNQKWWHRLMKVLFFLSFVFAEIVFGKTSAEYYCNVGIYIMFLIFLLPLRYSFWNIIYYKVIMYIIYGQSSNVSIYDVLKQKNKIKRGIMSIALVIVFAFVAYLSYSDICIEDVFGNNKIYVDSPVVEDVVPNDSIDVESYYGF